MEQPDVPLEQVQEDIHHHTHHAGHGPDGHAEAHAPELHWTRWVALSTALIAALAALAALAAGHTETEAMDAKMDANDTWSYYQAKSVKQHGLEDTKLILGALGKPMTPEIDAAIAKFKKEESELKTRATAYSQVSEAFLKAHTRYGYAVTMFQVAIALAAIAALTRRRRYWLISLGLGVIGIGFAVNGILLQSAITQPEPAEATSTAAQPPSTGEKGPSPALEKGG